MTGISGNSFRVILYMCKYILLLDCKYCSGFIDLIHVDTTTVKMYNYLQYTKNIRHNNIQAFNACLKIVWETLSP